MLLQKHLCSNLSNSSATSGFVWEKFDFESCDDFQSSKILWAVFIVFCFAFGFPPCVAILWGMFKKRRSGTPFVPNSFFILNLTIMDFVFLTFVPAGVINEFVVHIWEFEAFWNGSFALTMCGRPLLMACMCLDCYVAVVHPIVYHKTKTLTPRVVMVCIVWACTIGYGIAYFLFHALSLSFVATVPFLIAMVIIAVCDSFIFHALFKSGPHKNSIHPQKQRAVQTLTNSLIVSVISYLPPVILLGIGSNLCIRDTFICTIAVPLSLVFILGSVIMPLLHLNNEGKLGCFKLREEGSLNSYKITCCRC